MLKMSQELIPDDFVFILSSGFCYRMQQDGGFMKESLGETLREGFSCVYTD